MSIILLSAACATAAVSFWLLYTAIRMNRRKP